MARADTTILIVDDNADLTRVTALLLGGADLSVSFTPRRSALSAFAGTT